MGEVRAGPAGGDQAQAERRFLFATCFVSLVATSFAFVMRGFLIDQWQVEFGLSETQKGEILGAGLWPFGLSIVLFSLFIDRVGYGKSMIFAFVCHLVSVVLFVSSWGYWPLYIGSLLCGLAAGTVEAITNPAIASVYPKDKTRMLTLFHAGWPAGIVLNGIMIQLLGEVGLTIPWRYLVFLLLIPVIAYGVMLLKAKWPVSERVAAGVPYKDMLAEAGALGWLIVIYLVASEVGRICGRPPLLDTTFFDLPSWEFTALIVVTTGLYYWYTRSLGRWMYIFLLLVMIILAITELGTDTWMKELMVPSMGRLSFLMLIYSASVMLILRLAITPVQRALGNPLRILLVSAIMATIGIFCLSWAEGAFLILLFGLIYGMGQCYFWPMTLGLVGERFPRGGALTLNAVAGVGMLGVGILGSQIMGFWQDKGIDRQLRAADPAVYERLVSKDEKTSIFGSYRALDQTQVNNINDKVALFEYRRDAADTSKLLEDAKYGTLVRNAFNHLVREPGDVRVYTTEEMHKKLEEKGILIGEEEYKALQKDKKLVEEARFAAKKLAMARAAALPAIQAVCYLALIIYFKKRGGYSIVSLETGGGGAGKA